MWEWIKSLFKKNNTAKVAIPDPVQSTPITPISTPSGINTTTDFPYGKSFLDISHHNEKVDFAKLKDQALVILKCTEGSTYIDATFAERWESLKKCNIKRGAYHFYLTAKDPIDQAQHFLKTLGEFKPDDILALDFETKKKKVAGIWIDVQTNADLKANRTNAIKFMKAIRVLTGITPWFYTYHGVILSCDFGEEFAEFPLWYARYTSVRPEKKQGVWNEWIGWQYADNGKLDCISNDVDLNYFKDV